MRLLRLLKASTLRQKHLFYRGRIEFKAATLRDNIRVVPSQFRDAMLGGKCRETVAFPIRVPRVIGIMMVAFS